MDEVLLEMVLDKFDLAKALSYDDLKLGTVLRNRDDDDYVDVPHEVDDENDVDEVVLVRLALQTALQHIHEVFQHVREEWLNLQ